MSARTQRTPSVTEMHPGGAWTGRLLALLLIALLALWGLCGDEAGRVSVENQAGPGSVGAGEFFGTVVSGGFRAVFIDYLWMRAAMQETRNQYYDLHDTYDTLAYFQPHAEEVWEYNSNTMLQISTQYETSVAQYSWLRSGLAFAVRGLAYNPKSAGIRTYLAETLFLKFSYEFSDRSREFRRLMREDPDKSFLRDPSHPDPVHESLLYWDDVVASAPGDIAHQNRCYAALVLLKEQELGRREARLDMLNAMEQVLLSSPDESAANRALTEKRTSEYEAALTAPPLSREEEESLKGRISESLDYLEQSPSAAPRIIDAIKNWNSACDEVLVQIDAVLNLYEKALDAREHAAGANTSATPSAEEIKALESRNMNDILPVNANYVTQIYADAVHGLKRIVENKPADR